MSTVISVENLSKSYRLGQIGTGTLTDDLKVWWAKINNQPNPLLKIDQKDHANHDGETVWALKDIDLKVEQGDVIGIIGRNGAGKSTLLKILSRVTAPTIGKIKVNGRIASLLEVGTGFNPDLTGRENVFLNGAIFGMRKNEVKQKFDEIVSFAEVDKFIDTPVKRYSSGMYVRLAFAVAAHLDPDILLVDEVLAVGDISYQRKCLNKLKAAGISGNTVLLVSHDMAAITNFASKVALINKGELYYWGNPKMAIEEYNKVFKETKQKLKDRNDRNGDGVIFLKDIIINENLTDCDTRIMCGEEVKIKIDCTSQLAGISSDDIALDLTIFDSLNHPITTISTRFCPITPSKKFVKEFSLACYIPSLSLVQDTYFLSCWLSYRGGVADYISRAIEFEVLPNDYYKSGQEPVKKRHGAMLIEHKWSSE